MTRILQWIILSLAFFLVSSSELRTRDIIDELRSWIISNGGYVHPLLDFQVTKYGGISGIWMDDDPYSNKSKYTTIFLVPEKCLICSKSSSSLASLLLTEKLKGNDSFFKPFLNSLPSHIDLPWEWSDEEVLQLNDKYIINKIAFYRERMQKRYQLFAEGHPNLANQTTKEEFIYFNKIASTRSFSLDGRACLVPLADLPNHDYNGRVVWKTLMKENNTSFFQLQHVRVNIQKGKEYRFPYGRYLPNRKALLSYGFSSLDPEYTQDIRLKTEDIMSILALRTKKFPQFPEIDFSVFDPPDGSFVQTYRVIAASEAIYQLAKKSSQHVPGFFDRPISRKNEIETFRTCIKSVKGFLNSDETLYLENLNLLESTLSSRERFILFYRLGKERLFQKYLRFCQRMLQFATCSTYRGLVKTWVFNRSSLKLPKKIQHLTENLWRNEKELCHSKQLK